MLPDAGNGAGEGVRVQSDGIWSDEGPAGVGGNNMVTTGSLSKLEVVASEKDTWPGPRSRSTESRISSRSFISSILTLALPPDVSSGSGSSPPAQGSGSSPPQRVS